MFASLFLVRSSPRYGTSLLALMLVLGVSNVLRKITRKVCALVPKISRAGIHIIVSGSEAGKFSCVMPGFGSNRSAAMKISRCVTREIPPEPHDFQNHVKMLGHTLSSDCT